MNLKKDFPIFENTQDLVYLDSAATTQKPKIVIDSIKDYFEKYCSNVHRSFYPIGETATEKYENSRKIIAKFINAKPEEIIFTSGGTEAMNLLANSIKSLMVEGKDEILLTELEHHSNFLPWTEIAKKLDLKIKIAKFDKKTLNLDLEDLKKKLSERTFLIAFTGMSNVTGTMTEIEKIVNLVRKKNHNSLIVVDAAQLIVHKKIDVKKIDCDFLSFSGHKIYSSPGIGVLYGKGAILEKIYPSKFGGGMIQNIKDNGEIVFKEVPEKFEAGTQNIPGAISLAEAMKWLEKIGLKKIQKYEKKLLNYAIKELKKVPKIKLYLPETKNHSSIVSFTIEGIHPHDIAALLAEKNICIRAGQHCASPLFKNLDLFDGTARISFGIYNTKEDIDILVEELKKIVKKFWG